MEKSADAFRTISEVAEDLVLPQHVLRFWEQRFPQIRPLKRAGGRRYYRPADVVLLRSIRQLLHDEGYTIKGVQRLLKEQGARGLKVGDTPALPVRDGEFEPNGDAREAAAPSLPVAMAPEPLATAAHAAHVDRGVLREALTLIEEGERILAAVRRPMG